MCNTKVLRKAALLVASAAELLLATSSVPWKEGVTPPIVEPGDGWTQLWEPRLCTACGTEGQFWAIYEPEGAESHAYMTMCMSCGAINGDLPEEDPAYWLNVFRTEPHDNTVYVVEPDCTLTGTRETVCFRCGWSTVETLPALGHQYSPWRLETPPGPGTEGMEVRTCERCGLAECRPVPALPATPSPAETSAAPPETAVPPERGAPEETPSADPTPENSSSAVPTETREPVPSDPPMQSASPAPTPRQPEETEVLPIPQVSVPAETMPETPAPAQTANPTEIPSKPPETPPVSSPSPSPEGEPLPVPPEDRPYGPYVTGTPEGLFLPKKPATRAEVLLMVARVLADRNGDILPDGQPFYADVPQDRWYSGGVTYLVSLGILPEGGGTALLDPDHLVSEADLAAFLSQVFEGSWTGDAGKIVSREDCVVWINRAAGRRPDAVWMQGHMDQLKTFPDVTQEDGAWYAVLDAANGNRNRVH